MRCAVIVYPGATGDHDVTYLVRNVLKAGPENVWYEESDLGRFDMAVLPGGYGAQELDDAPIMAAVKEFAKQGKPVLGIASGFGRLLEAGLLPGQLRGNRDGRFVNGMVYLRLESGASPFTAGLEVGRTYRMPIAHYEGNYRVDEEELASLRAAGQIAFRYVNAAGEATLDANPDESVANIAGLLNREGNVLGLMPHPERAYEAILGSADGLRLFQSVMRRA